MRISKIFEDIAKSKVGQKFFKWASSPGKDKFINNTLPTLETGFATVCYVISTERQKNLGKEEKKLLQYQNVLSGVAGMALGTVANRWISNKTDAIVKDLDPTKLDPKALRKTATGLRVFAPIVTTALLMRWIIPTIIAGVSGKMMDKEREKQKLDVKA